MGIGENVLVSVAKEAVNNRSGRPTGCIVGPGPGVEGGAGIIPA